MNIILLLVVAFVSITLLMLIAFTPVRDNSEGSLMGELDAELQIDAYYVGGLKTVLEKTKCTLLIVKDKIIFNISFKNVNLLIHFNKVTKIELKSQNELREDVSISSLFFSKNIYLSKATDENKYLVISYIDFESTEERKLVINSADSKEFMKKYKKAFSTWNCEYNNICELEVVASL
jgi:hypothetical protein